MNDRYWVGNGGDWSDAASHWATISGGTPNIANLPDASTDVHFDANSFTIGGQSVVLDADAYCKDMDWTGVTNAPSVGGAHALWISGNFTCPSGVTWSGALQFTGSSEVSLSSGSTLYSVKAQDSFTGTLTIINNLTVTFGIECYKGSIVFGSGITVSTGTSIGVGGGTINFGNATVHVGTYIWADSGLIKFGSAIVTAPGDIDTNGSGATIEFESATVNVPGIWTGPGSMYFGASAITTGSINNNVGIMDFGSATVNATDHIFIAGTADFGTAIIHTPKVQFDGQHSLSSFPFQGSPGNLVEVEGGTLSMPSGIVSCDYLKLTDSHVVGGATWYAGSHSIDNGGNEGWVFADAPAHSSSWVGTLNNQSLVLDTTLKNVNALQTDVNALQTDVNALQTDVNALLRSHGEVPIESSAVLGLETPVLYLAPTVEIAGTLSAPFTLGETVSGDVSGATGVVIAQTAGSITVVVLTSAVFPFGSSAFDLTDTVTGDLSGSMVTAITAIDTIFPVGMHYMVDDLVLNFEDPDPDTMDARLYKLDNGALSCIKTVSVATPGGYCTLANLFGQAHLAGDQIEITVEVHDGGSGPYAVTGSYAYRSAYNGLEVNNAE
jgi:ElaB/YqjD/DUF883 family membrane-anchored ribosome-binding protein